MSLMIRVLDQWQEINELQSQMTPLADECRALANDLATLQREHEVVERDNELLAAELKEWRFPQSLDEEMRAVSNAILGLARGLRSWRGARVGEAMERFDA